MSSFGEAIKDALNREQVEKEQASKKVASTTRYRYDVETDPNDHMDTIITLYTEKEKDGKTVKNELQKLFILYSQQKVMLQIKGDFVTDDYTYNPGIDKFFSHMPKTEARYIGSSVMHDFQPDKTNKVMIKAMIKCPKMMECLKNKDMTYNEMYEHIFSSWRRRYVYIEYSHFTWMTQDQRNRTNSYSEDEEEMVHEIMIVFEGYTSNNTNKKFVKECQRIGIDMRLLDKEMMDIGIMLGDYFDVPFAAKCIKEYTEDGQLGGLTYNCLDELLSLKQGQRNYRVYGGGNYDTSIGFNYTAGYKNMRTDILADTEGIEFVKFKDKNAFWSYITKRSHEENFNMCLARYINHWKDNLMAEIYIYNDVLNLYPSQYKYIQTDEDEVRMLTRDISLESRRARNLNKCWMISSARANGNMEVMTKVIGDILEGDYEYYGRTYYFKCLRTQDDYEAEGKAMGNCVGSICLSRVLQGENMTIFSLRKGEEREQSWITVDVDPFTGEFPSRVGRALKRYNTPLNEDEKKLISHIEAECVKKVKAYNRKKREEFLEKKKKNEQ